MTKAERAYRKRHRKELAAKLREYRKRNPDKFRAYEIRKVHKTHMPTRPDPGFCEACGKVQVGRHLSVDHDHTTDKFRGWLCNGCNAALGHVRDSIAGLRLLIAYLEKHGDYSH